MEKNRKIAHILSSIVNSRNLSKIDIRKQTFYSMSTINAALTHLLKEKLITVNKQKDNNVIKNIINYNAKKIVAGVSMYRKKLYATIMNLRGEVICFTEKDICKEVIDIADNVTSVLESLLTGLNHSLASIGISVASNDINSLEKVLALRFGVPVYSMDHIGAIAMYYRYIVSKNNSHIVALYIGKHIRSAKVMDACEWLELGNLLSPIISAKKGRLLYDEVLSSDTVKGKIVTRYGNLEAMFESSIFEKDIFSYAKQIKYALGELLLLLDKTLKPRTIIVAGDYISEELVEGSLDTLGDNVRANVVSFGNGSKQIVEGSACIALNSLLYY